MVGSIQGSKSDTKRLSRSGSVSGGSVGGAEKFGSVCIWSQEVSPSLTRIRPNRFSKLFSNLCSEFAFGKGLQLGLAGHAGS